MRTGKKLNRVYWTNKTIIPLFFVVLCLLGGCGRRQESSSAARLFQIETDEEAVYLVSTAETAVDVQEADKDAKTAAGEEKADTVQRERTGEAGTVSGNTIDGLPKEVEAVFFKVNQVREDAGLSALLWSDELAEAADIRAKEIQQTFSHTRPDGSEWWSVNREIIYGENLAKGYQSADSVMEAWMESVEHKENILYAAFRSIGIAVYEYDGKWYWAQEFGY